MCVSKAVETISNIARRAAQTSMEALENFPASLLSDSSPSLRVVLHQAKDPVPDQVGAENVNLTGGLGEDERTVSRELARSLARQ